MQSILFKVLRIAAIVLMGLTAAFTVMSGAGTSCVALAAEKFGEKMAPIAPYQWLYVVFVLVTTAVGAMGIRSVVLLIKGRSNAYRASVIALVLGIVVGAIHMAVSRSLRGSSQPVDMVVYTTAFTLIVFLLLRIPAIRQGVGFGKPEASGEIGRNAAAITLAICGLLSLTIQYWMAPTHTIGGVNYSDAWHTALVVIGWGLMASSAMVALVPNLVPTRREILAPHVGIWVPTEYGRK